MEYFQVNEAVPCLKVLRTLLLLNAEGIQKVRFENKEYLNAFFIFYNLDLPLNLPLVLTTNLRKIDAEMHADK
jgi:hypothetical protein